KAMVMAEQMQPRLHRGKDLVNLRLAGVGSASAGKRPERLRRFVRHEDVDAGALQGRAPLDFLAHEVAPLVRKFCRLRAALLWVRKLGCGRLVPRRRESP